jgi:hypothetical protein
VSQITTDMFYVSQAFPCPFPIHISGFAIGTLRQVSLMEQDMLPFRNTWVRPQFLVGFVLLDLQFSVKCFEDRCLFFFIWPLSCLSFDLQIVTTPLESWHLNGLLYEYCSILPFAEYYVHSQVLVQYVDKSIATCKKIHI